jgi:hypothetical protein
MPQINAAYQLIIQFIEDYRCYRGVRAAAPKDQDREEK